MKTLLLLIMLPALLIGLAISAIASEVETVTGGADPSEFIAPNGRFDLDAARRAGFEGSLNLDGFDVRLDEETGAPIISRSSGERDADDEYWRDLSVADAGMNDFINSLTVYNGDLIAGGNFTTAGIIEANSITSWNNSDGSWSSLGSGVNNAIGAMTIFNDTLIVGGRFAKAGDKAAAYLAAWTKDYPTAVLDDPSLSLPGDYILRQNYPNPFNPITTIEYNLPVKANVTIDVYNLLGQRVKRLFDSEKSYGPHSITWDGTDQKGRTVGTGIYFYQIKAGEYVESKKMLLLK